LSGICGTAMASLAGLLKERGDEVTGSDENVYPPMSLQLEALGLRLRTPFSEANVPKDAELVVIGNALSRGNPEVEVVLDRRQPMASLPALIGEEFIRGRTSLVVAGTHGKTTTTALTALILERAGLDPSFLVGGLPLDFARSYHLGKGEHFVVEGDEYDCAFFDKRPKFVHYRPDVAIIGNLERDHVDIYPDLQAVQTAFVRLIDLIPRRGLLIVGAESPALLEILPRCRARLETFGLSSSCDWRAEDIRPDSSGWRFRLVERGRDAGEFVLGIPGEHNVRNALAALAMSAAAGVPPERARSALAAFRGVRRRLEIVGQVRGVTVYDDFAHHPSAVRETLKTLRRIAPVGDRIIAVFEPRSYTSRTRVFQDEFASALTQADEAIIAGAYGVTKVPEAERVSEHEIVQAVCASGGRARFRGTVDEILQLLAAETRGGDHIVILSNGGFGGIQGRLLDALRLATSPA